VQTLADLGLTGLLISVALAGFWLIAATSAVGRGRGLGGATAFSPERVGLLTLLSIVVIFAAHSFVDWTWFVPGTCVLALLCAGWVAGRGPQEAPERAEEPPGPPVRARLAAARRDPLRVAAAAGAVAIALACAWATWQPLRAVNAGDDSLELVSEGKIAQARDAAQRAHDINPLSTEPLSDLAVVEQKAGDTAAGRRALEQAVQLQPQNPTPWLRLAGYQLDVLNDPQGALSSLGAALYLDPRSQTGVSLFLDATRRANGGGSATAPGGAQTTPPATATP